MRSFGSPFKMSFPPLNSQAPQVPTKPAEPVVETPAPAPTPLGVSPSSSSPDEQGQRADFVAAAPPAVKPMVTSLPPGEYKIKGGWRLVVDAASLTIDQNPTTADTISGGQMELTAGTMSVLVAFGVVNHSTDAPQEEEKPVGEADKTIRVTEDAGGLVRDTAAAAEPTPTTSTDPVGGA